MKLFTCKTTFEMLYLKMKQVPILMEEPLPQLDKQQQKETAACDHQGKCSACALLVPCSSSL